MAWQPPTQPSNAMAYPYFAYYSQQDSNQPNLNYDEDNEGWDDDENEGYQNQNAYYYNDHQNVDTTVNMGGYDGAVSTHYKIHGEMDALQPRCSVIPLPVVRSSFRLQVF